MRRAPIKVREIIQGPADHKVWRLLLLVKRDGMRPGTTYDSIEYIREIRDGKPLEHVARFRKAAMTKRRGMLPKGSQPWIRIEPAIEDR